MVNLNAINMRNPNTFQVTYSCNVFERDGHCNTYLNVMLGNTHRKPIPRFLDHMYEARVTEYQSTPREGGGRCLGWILSYARCVLAVATVETAYELPSSGLF